MEEQEALGTDPIGEGKRVAQPRMSPSEMLRVLGVGVLAIVDQERCPLRQIEAGDPLRIEPGELGAETGLVVGYVAKRRGALRDPVPERRPTMRDRRRSDPCGADLPLDVRAVPERDVARELAHLDRRKRGRDVARDPVLERCVGSGRSPDDDLGVRPEGRGEEHETLDVVEVKVGQKDVELRRPGRQGEAEVADAGACVEGENRSVFERDLNA